MELNDITSVAVKRRKLLAAGVLGGATVLFGASFFESPGTADPVVEGAGFDGWEQTTDDDESTTMAELGPIQVQTATSTHQYEHRALGEQVRQQPVESTADGETRTEPLSSYVGDGFGNTLMTFSATRIDFSPDLNNLPLGVGRAEILDAVVGTATENFRTQFQNAGANNLQQTDRSELSVDTGETAELVEYSSQFPFDGFTVSASGTDVTFPSDTLELAGKLAVWNHGDYAIVATGTYPAANYANEATETTDDGQEVTVAFDLGLDPQRHEETVTDLMTAVR